MKDANEIIENTETRKQKVEEYLRPAAEFFHDHEGKLFERKEAVQRLEAELEVSSETADELISELVSDTVDPVIQVPRSNSRYVGVVEFHEFDGAYGYLEYDDVIGQRKRVVCQQCVNKAEYDTEVAHATEKSRNSESSTYKKEADYPELLEKVHNHYEQVHEVVPSDVETGATLASGTTIGGNDAYHSGNFSRYTDSEAVSAVDGSTLSKLTIEEIIDGSGTSHTSELADKSEIPSNYATIKTFTQTFSASVMYDSSKEFMVHAPTNHINITNMELKEYLSWDVKRPDGSTIASGGDTGSASWNPQYVAKLVFHNTSTSASLSMSADLQYIIATNG